MSNEEKQITVSRTIDVAPEIIFEILRDTTRHQEMDGSGTVRKPVAAKRLGPNDTFSMSMRYGVPYRVKNRVVDFEENRRIAWRHVGRHVWSYDLEPTGDATKVTETFDYGPSLWPEFALKRMGMLEGHRRDMERTLERLEEMAKKDAESG